MKNIQEYGAGDPMSALVEGNYHALLVMSRFGLKLGFGDGTIGEVCAASDVDADTFLAVVNLTLDEGRQSERRRRRVSPDGLLRYLVNSHDYFLDFRLPAIRRELVEVLDDPSSAELAAAVLRYFDEYVGEVGRHMRGEERVLFPYVAALARGERTEGAKAAAPHKKHDRMQQKLSEFKRILIKYYPARSTNRLNSVLFDIYNCESDMASHNEVEELLLAPVIEELERKNGEGAK